MSCLNLSRVGGFHMQGT